MDAVEEHYIVEVNTGFYPAMRYSYDRLLRHEISDARWSDPIERIRIVRIRRLDGHYIRIPVGFE